MFPIDPTLYGATLPQRELPVPLPFIAQQAQNVPWQLPLQNLPWQNAQVPTFNRFVPPMFQHGIPPYYTQGYGYTQPFMNPFNPMAFSPYVPTGIPGLPYVPTGIHSLPLNSPQAWQKPWC